jgi:putative endonuclease
MDIRVYILRSISFDRFYIGKTSDINERLKRHNAGREKSTKPYLPWQIIYLSEALSGSEASVLERKLKNLKSRKRVLHFIQEQESQRVTGPEKL